MKPIFLVAAIIAGLLASSSSRAFGSGFFSFEPDERLFTVYAFMNVSGYDHDYEEPHAIRKAIKEHLRGSLPDTSVARYRAFYKSYGGHFSGFGTYALLLGAPPKFSEGVLDTTGSGEYSEYVGQVSNDFAGLSALLRDFYQKGNLGMLWERYWPQLRKLNEPYAPFGKAALENITSYSRVPKGYFSNVAGKIHFTICPQMSHLTAYTTKVAGELFIVHGPPTGEPGPDAYYHEALHHVIGPVVNANLSHIRESSELLAISKRHRTIGYDDWPTVVEESLVRTIHKILAARDYGSSEKQLRKNVAQEYRLGFILCLYLLEALPEYERSGSTLEAYFPRFFSDLDLRREKERWKRFWSRDAGSLE